jgi:hypothetical protein
MTIHLDNDCTYTISYTPQTYPLRRRDLIDDVRNAQR